ncbi:GGDEF domain-containing protein [Bradyrhizobium sp. AUGA SZCCT0182]|uniref:sensor domain-containing diguanylate cyclase n=1 Tax=Bradyrhizobium sp. AUGA SZCCT0182 TaxID=2807667 RepID=UPI001BA678AD|nr:diguanylate cyclase [Bradyrhizobium sp. AUGA SZCCT0182]MBR1235864.1 GGDEF domain-containing protein [Bradyrhizobium sp. AUGA SZCCT0182]
MVRTISRAVQFWALVRTAFSNCSHSEAKTAEKENEIFRLIAENSNDVIICLGPGNVPTYVSPSATHVLGWDAKDLLAKGPESFVHPDDLGKLLEAQTIIESGTAERVRFTSRVIKPDGTIVWVEGSSKAYCSKSGKSKGAVLVVRDITERKALEDRLNAMALMDGLTGLFNRRAFDKTLEEELGPQDKELSLLLLDIDHFKAFNDCYGHQAGDDCLRQIGGILNSISAAQQGIAARIGGEEFAIILPKVDAAGSLSVAELVRTTIQRLRIPHDGNLECGGYVTASIGVSAIAHFARSGLGDAKRLVSGADSALYRAKHEGRNRVAGFIVPADDECSIVPELDRDAMRRTAKKGTLTPSK